MTGQRQIVGKASLLIVLSSCAFGSLSTLTVLVRREGLSLLPTMFWRYLLAACLLLALLRGRVVRDISSQQAYRLILVGGFGQALITYLSLHALEYLPVGTLGFLFYTYPAWLAVISAIFGRESLTMGRFIALSIAMMGIAIMVGASGPVHLNTFGVMLALGTALLYALYLPALNHVQDRIPAAIASFYLVCGVLVAFLAANLATGQLQMPGTTAMWGYLAALSLFSTVIAFAALIAGLRVLGPVRTSIVATIEPFFTALLGTVLLGEALTRSIFTGGALIAAAVLILQLTAKDSRDSRISA